LARDESGVVVCSVVVVVPSIGRAGTIVVAAHIRDRRGVHTSLDHGRRTRGERTVTIGDHLGIVVKHPGLTSEDVRIKGVPIPPFVQTANEVEDSEYDSSDTQDSSGDSANNGPSRNIRARIRDISAVTCGRRLRGERSERGLSKRGSWK
jgi:hypothetical protein